MSPHLHLVEERDEQRVERVALLRDVVLVPRQGTELLSGAPRHDLVAHLASYGPRPACGGTGADRLLDDLERSGLTGRGGGHFPAVAKWRSVRAAGGAGTVVANGAEGEPASAKDAVLLQLRPHLVLDGLVAAMDATGAIQGVVWLHQGAVATERSVLAALAERESAGLGDPRIRVLLAPDRYLSGEATGIIRTLEGGPTLPRFVEDPARPWSAGARPVLVHNVETLARVALLAAHGPDDAGTSSLLTVVSPGHRVVLDVDRGATFGQVVAQAWTSPDGAPPDAVLLGGYGGSWVPWDRLRGLPVDGPALRREGLSIGAGLVAPLPTSACGLQETARLVRYLSDQSARQCGPCVFGLASVASLVEDLADGRLSAAGRRRLGRFMGEISGRGACRHPDGALRMLASALTVFEPDVRRHRRGRTCAASSYAVLPLPGGR